MSKCPRCKAEEIYRSRARSRWETWRKEFTRKRPHRCRACGWRGWVIATTPGSVAEDPNPIVSGVASHVTVLEGTIVTPPEDREADFQLGRLDEPESADK